MNVLLSPIISAVCGGLPVDMSSLIEGARRSAPRTSHVEWTIAHHGGYNDGLVERLTTETVSGSILEDNYGDEQGMHELRFRGKPSFADELSREEALKFAWTPEIDAGTRRVLSLNDKVYINPIVERPISGRVGSRGHHDGRQPVDFEIIGFAPALWSEAKNMFGVPDMWLEGLDSAVIMSSHAGAMRTVSAEFGTGNEFRWFFDPRISKQPVRAEFWLSGYLQYASETDFKDTEGRMFPQSVRYYKDDPLNPYKVLHVGEASFDQPWHRQEIGLADMGYLYGTYFSTDDGAQYWDGRGFISDTEFWDYVYLYDLLPDSAVIEGLTKSAGMTPAQWIARQRAKGEVMRAAYKREHGEEPWLINVQTEENDPWDVYVEEFIKKNELPEAAVKRAKDQLERAKRVRDAQRRKNHKAFKEAERRKDQEKLDKFKEREERIFKEMLVRPLDKLAKQAKENTATAEKRD